MAEDIRSAFEKRKESAWTQVYEDYFEKFTRIGMYDGNGTLSPQILAVFRQAAQRTTSLFTNCDNDLDMSDYLFQMREDLEQALTTINGGKT